MPWSALAGGYESQGATARKELGIAEGQLRDYETRLGRPFAHDAYLTELTSLRDELKAALSDTPREPGAKPLQASEIAERIQAMRAGHAIDPAPERLGKRREHAAEAPVTSRIRDRTGSLAAEPETDLPPPPASPPKEAARVTYPVELKLSKFSLPLLPRLDAARRLAARSRSPRRGEFQPDRQLNLF